MQELNLIDGKRLKIINSPEYNYIFNKTNGFFARWGATKHEDPSIAPFPEILDIEVTTICNNGCPFCYKGNTKNGHNMLLETFKGILDKMEYNGTPFLTQIAFGADAGATSNPNLFDMMRYARSKGIVPNITVADITDTTADTLVELCGAVAVSRYTNKNKCYDSVKKLTDRGFKQTNIHVMLSQETLEQVWETIKDYKDDERLRGLNAIVILSLKKKGRGLNHKPVSQFQFNELVKYSLDNGVPLGFDSCSAPKFLKAVEDHPQRAKFEMLAEPCESTLFSSYINVDGEFFSCSFCEDNKSFGKGIKVLEHQDFIQEVWMGESTKVWRQRLLDRRASGDFSCPVFEV